MNGEKLTNAALLYSDQNPVVGSFISCTRWDGLDKLSAKDDIEFYGSILDQIDNAMEFIKKHMSNGWVKEGGKLARRTIPEYDLDAMREAIINAEAHRSYLMRGTNVELAFYDDRIEIVSCGTKKILLAYENDEKKPKFEIIGDVFIVTFYSRLYRNVERNDDNVDTNVERNVERKIKGKYPELSNISINILNKAPNTIYRNIKVLKDMGIIERVGSTKKGYWRINF